MGRRILVVEDDPGYQELAAMVFTGFDVVVRKSVEDAAELLSGQKFDLVFSDLDLLGVTGFEVLERLKSSPVNRETPVVFCSAHSEPDIRQRAMDAGAAGFVPKPFDSQAVVSLVEALVKP